jgi:hypothetical protein
VTNATNRKLFRITAATVEAGATNPLAKAEKMGENLHRNDNDSHFGQTDNAVMTMP